MPAKGVSTVDVSAGWHVCQPSMYLLAGMCVNLAAAMYTSSMWVQCVDGARECIGPLDGAVRARERERARERSRERTSAREL